MPNVPYPSGVVVERGNNFCTCVEYLNDPLTITFVDSGMIFPTATGVFRPDIPFGLYEKGVTIGPFLPISGEKGLIVYFGDLTNLKMFTNTIIICTKCNSPTDPKCA
jgi:hypothetical protein